MRSAFTWAGASLCSVLPRPTAILAHGLQKERVLRGRSDAQSHKAHTGWAAEKCQMYREVFLPASRRAGRHHCRAVHKHLFFSH